MKTNLLQIINHYGINNQLKHFQSEVFELIEAILQKDNIEHIAEEIADVLVMLEQLRLYYNIDEASVITVMDGKIERQLRRIADESRA